MPRHFGQVRPGLLLTLGRVSVGVAPLLIMIAIASDKCFAMPSALFHLRGPATESASPVHSSCAARAGSPSGFTECAWTRLSDGASFVAPEITDPCTYYQCWAENNWPKKGAYHRWAVYFGLRFDGFTSTELFAPCTNLCFGAVQTSPRT